MPSSKLNHAEAPDRAVDVPVRFRHIVTNILKSLSGERDAKSRKLVITGIT